MRKGRFDNKTLDAAGRRLIAESSRTSAEAERVVSDPLLFTRVKARIAAEQTAKEHVSFFAGVQSLLARHALLFAGVLTLGIVGASFFANRSAAPKQTAKVDATNIERTDIVRPADPPAVDTVQAKVPVDRTPLTDARPHFEKAVYRPPISRPAKASRSVPVADDNKFYAVSFTGDPSETDSGGRIVRVEMSRSSLFAMGVNVPLENDDTPVRADLLIGRDGVTRAIRVVK